MSLCDIPSMTPQMCRSLQTESFLELYIASNVLVFTVSWCLTVRLVFNKIGVNIVPSIGSVRMKASFQVFAILFIPIQQVVAATFGCKCWVSFSGLSTIGNWIRREPLGVTSESWESTECTSLSPSLPPNFCCTGSCLGGVMRAPHFWLLYSGANTSRGYLKKVIERSTWTHF